jgi:hypothetical protein
LKQTLQKSIPPTAIRKFLLWIALAFVAPGVQGATTLDFWHSYRHAQAGETHYAFHLSQFKRGLFWGSCGPSTKSLQWSFNFDLAGEGPDYSAARVSVSDDNGQAVKIISGQVITDMKRMTAKIDIEFESGGHTNKFPGNGDYRIHKLK